MNHQLTTVVIVDDDPTSSLLYASSLRKSGYQIVTCSGLRSAMDWLNKNSNHGASLLVTDLQLTDGKGLDLIKQTRKLSKSMPIIVISGDSDPASIIEVMRENVQDYIIKPVSPSILLTKVEYHLSKSDSDYQKSIYEKERIISLEKLIDWYNFKNRKLEADNFDSSALHKNLFHILRASLSQGAGFGILLQLIGIIQATKKDEFGNHILQKEILEILEDNASYAKKVIDAFTEIEDVIFGRVSIVQGTIKELISELDSLPKELKSFLAIKNQSLSIGIPNSEYSYNKQILWEKTFFKKIIKELLLNAMKFSPQTSKIVILIYLDQKEISISIINPMNDDNRVGEVLPEEYHDLIFEPFFRLNKNIYEAYQTLDFGIGLSLVKETVVKFGGSINVRNLIDHLDSESKGKVEFKIKFPYV